MANASSLEEGKYAALWLPKELDQKSLTLCWHSIDAHDKDILTVNGCSTNEHKMQTVFIDSQYIVSMYQDMHPNALRPLSFWAPSIYVIWAMNDIDPLR